MCLPAQAPMSPPRALQPASAQPMSAPMACCLSRPIMSNLRRQDSVEHFGAIAEAVSCDVMLYSVPGRTGVSIAPETVAELARTQTNVVAIKEAGGDAARVTALRAAAGPNFVVHCGDDGLALPFYALGARGLTSVLSNWRPAECVALHRAWADGQRETALALHEELTPLAAAMFLEPSPAPVKHLLAREGLIEEVLRLPLTPVTPQGAIALATF